MDRYETDDQTVQMGPLVFFEMGKFLDRMHWEMIDLEQAHISTGRRIPFFFEDPTKSHMLNQLAWIFQ